MQIFQAAIMGAAQGLTEFLPISSSGHIVLVSALYKMLTGTNFNIVQTEEIFFDILIHLSTLFAIIIYFFKDIKNITRGFFISLLNKNFKNENYKFGIYIIAATFATGVFGILIKDAAHKITENPFLVSLFLILTGIILFSGEKFKKKENPVNLKTALFIGLAQGLAVLPGISRSGATISSAVFQGVKRVDAAKFSFILSIPIIILASLIYPLLTFDLSEIKSFNLPAIAVGMLVSFIVGYICIKYFMKFLERRGLSIFAYYCIIAGVICAVIFY